MNDSCDMLSNTPQYRFLRGKNRFIKKYARIAVAIYIVIIFAIVIGGIIFTVKHASWPHWGTATLIFYVLAMFFLWLCWSWTMHKKCFLLWAEFDYIFLNLQNRKKLETEAISAIIRISTDTAPWLIFTAINIFIGFILFLGWVCAVYYYWHELSWIRLLYVIFGLIGFYMPCISISSQSYNIYITGKKINKLLREKNYNKEDY